MRRRLRLNDWKCQRTIESREKTWLNDSMFPLQMGRRPMARTAVLRISRCSESQRGQSRPTIGAGAPIVGIFVDVLTGRAWCFAVFAGSDDRQCARVGRVWPGWRWNVGRLRRARRGRGILGASGICGTHRLTG
jgi:hypothetical protein